MCPSKESSKGLTPIYEDSSIVGYEEVSQVSFENDILRWLNKCVSHQETIKIAPIREVILQFIGVIRSMANLLVEDKEDEIVSAIVSSKENIKSAIEIEKNKENNYKTVNTYYDKKWSTYPGLSYFIKSLDKKDVDLLLRFEINYNLFAGFCTPYKNKFNGKQLDTDEINNLLCIDEQCNSGWWIYWEYLPHDNESTCPNFKDFNEAYFDLFDECKFNKFIDLCVESILNLLDRLK